MDMQVVGAADDLAAPLARRDRAQHAATIRGSSEMAHPTSIDGLQYRAGIDARSRQLTSDPPPVEDEDSFVLCRAMATSSMCQGQPKCAATIARAGWAAATASSRLPGGVTDDGPDRGGSRLLAADEPGSAPAHRQSHGAIRDDPAGFQRRLHGPLTGPARSRRRKRDEPPGWEELPGEGQPPG